MSDFPTLKESMMAASGQSNNGTMSFSAIAGRGVAIPRKSTTVAEFTSDDFPALGKQSQSLSSDQAQFTDEKSLKSREELLMSNLLGGGKSLDVGMTASANSTTSAANTLASRLGLKQSSSQLQPAPGFGTIGGAQSRSSSSERPKAYSGLGSIGSSVGGAFGPSSSSQVPVLPTVQKQQLQGENYGLVGLIDIIRMTNEDVSMLALGSDLTSLGLPLNSGESIYGSFMTPFSDAPSVGSDPDFDLPSCYPSSLTLTSLTPLVSRLDTVSEETLFYVFYGMPRHPAQEVASQTLYKRGWRFHKELKLWLSQDTSPTRQPSVKGPNCEKGVFVFFDPSSWTKIKKEWLIYYDLLEERGEIGSALRGGESLNTSRSPLPPNGDIPETTSLGESGNPHNDVQQSVSGMASLNLGDKSASTSLSGTPSKANSVWNR